MLSLLTEAPHLICLTEQHLNNDVIDVTPICNYKLGAKYCRKKLKNGGVCIYIQEALKFTTICLQKHCKEQDIEISAVQLKLNKKNVIIFCVCRAVIIFCVYRALWEHPHNHFPPRRYTSQ